MFVLDTHHHVGHPGATANPSAACTQRRRWRSGWPSWMPRGSMPLWSFPAIPICGATGSPTPAW